MKNYINYVLMNRIKQFLLKYYKFLVYKIFR